MIYLDAAASANYSKVDDIIVDTITNAMRESWMNPSSLYATKVKKEVEKCRANIARFIDAKPEEVYFTSGASESNSWVFRGWSDKTLEEKHVLGNIITTPIEHKSILEVAKKASLGAETWFCSVDKFGRVDIQHLITMLKEFKDEPILVSICMANNEIGTVQDIKNISDLVHEFNGVLHVDATQAFGHIPIDVDWLGIDMLSASGHKVSPVLKGVGLLYKRNGIEIDPLIYGNQENGLRGGTTNTFGVIGLAKAIELCDISIKKIEDIVSKRDYFIGLLESKFNCKLNGHSHYRLPNNINVTFPQNVTGESILYTLELSDIYVSTSSACNSYLIEPSHVLMRIGLTYEQAMRSVRFSLSSDITYEEIDKVICEIDKSLKLISL